jgi:hypothetical protein
MGAFVPVTDDDLARARRDRGFRRKLLADNLERLLNALNALRNAGGGADPEQARQIREGVDLAMQLSNRLHCLGEGAGTAA